MVASKNRLRVKPVNRELPLTCNQQVNQGVTQLRCVNCCIKTNYVSTNNH